MPNKRAKQMLALALDESGAAAVVVAVVFAVLCGFVGLAMDYGHMVMVKAELQRTADAGVLAGAAGLAPYNNPGPNETPNWVNAQNKAQAIINNAANNANNQIFTIPVDAVKTGYWLLKPPTGYVQPPLPTVRPTDLTYLPEPAVTATLSRDVTLYLAPLIGISSAKTVSASATAILPEGYSTTNIPPIALDPDTVYNVDANGFKIIDLSDQDVQPFSNKGKASWFNLTGPSGDNSVPSVRINTPLTSAKDKVYLVPGTKATLTDFVHVGDTIVLPVVTDVEKFGWEDIIQWAAFKIEHLDANSMHGNFLNEYFDPNVIPYAGGPPTLPSAVMGMPKLVSP
jgi:Flp pilus assembly protein TadG